MLKKFHLYDTLFLIFLGIGLFLIIFKFILNNDHRMIIYGDDIPSSDHASNPVKQSSTKNSEDVSTSNPEKNICRLIPMVPKIGAYHGAFADFGSTEDDVTIEKINHFQDLAQKKIAWAYFSDNWFDGIEFPQKQVEILKKMGVTPFIRLMPRSSLDVYQRENKFTLDNILKGDFDEELIAWAQSAKQEQVPLLVEFGTEVNGDWFSWNGKWNGASSQSGYGDPLLADGPEKFRNAYRHIIDLFNKEEAYNIAWVYHINAISSPKQEWNNFMSYYPGDDYIDWIGISAYGAQSGNEKQKGFKIIFDSVYKQITNQTKKPIALVEFGVADGENASIKAGWIQDVLSSLKKDYPLVKAVSYWQSSWIDEGVLSDLRINSTSQSLEAYREGISDTYYIESISFTTCK